MAYSLPVARLVRPSGKKRVITTQRFLQGELGEINVSCGRMASW